QKAYAYAGYLAINISSPNTPGLRNMQNAGELETLLAELTRLRTVLRAQSGRYVPLALKVAPDLSAQQIDDITRATVDYGIDALIVGNTTVERPGIAGAHAHETGGLSGKPLLPLATRTLQSFAQRLQGKIPLIGVGGISSGADAVAKIKAGATLIQIYSGLIYRGPGLLGEISKALKKTRE
ncbi:MAG TPA: dihydroorotate dehydrogenase 2, partial [Gammaproteobacteria bacterium]